LWIHHEQATASFKYVPATIWSDESRESVDDSIQNRIRLPLTGACGSPTMTDPGCPLAECRMKHLMLVGMIVITFATIPGVCDSTEPGQEPAQLRNDAKADLAAATAAAQRGDFSTALTGFSKLAKQGNAEAQSSLGYLYARGYGVAKNDREAAKWYRLAAEQGNSMAQSNLGSMYSDGEGVPQDYTEAFKWYDLAARQGDALGQYNLGVAYANGEGVPRNYVKAYAWILLADAQGLELPKTKKTSIARMLTADQMAEAKALAAQCQRSQYKDCD
jgi:hypothetical protein